MKHLLNTAVLAFCIGAGILFGASAIGAETIAASSISAADLLQPASLDATLQSNSGVRPLVLQVGLRAVRSSFAASANRKSKPCGRGSGT